MVAYIRDKDRNFFSSLQLQLSKSFIKTKGIHNEVCLVNTIHLLNQEMYDKAHQETAKMNSK